MNVPPAPITFPPGPSGLPILGHLPQLNSNALGFLCGLARTYGPASSYRVGRQRVALFSRPETVREVLIERASSFGNAELSYILRPIVGDSILTTDEADHRRLRRLVQPAFTRRRVDTYRDTMVAHVERMLARWSGGQTLDMGREMQNLTLGIIAEVAVGVQSIDDAGVLGDAISRASQLTKHRWIADAFLLLMQARGNNGAMRILTRLLEQEETNNHLLRGRLARIPGTPMYKLAEIRSTIDELVYDVIRRRRAATDGVDDVLASLLTARDDDGTALDDELIRDQVVTLLTAGYGTTAVGLTWSLYLLSQHPEAAATLRMELNRVLQGQPPTADDLENLPYLDQVWNESLRLYPPVWAISRLCHDEVSVAGYTLPAGTIVMVSPWVTHRLPDVFRDPYRYRPERFDLVQGERHPAFAYYPFGAGHRMCIGSTFATLEGKLILAMIMQRFVPQMVPGHRVAAQPLVVLRPAHGMRMIVHDAHTVYHSNIGDLAHV